MRLIFIHFFACLAIWLSTYIVGLDIFLSIIYLIIIYAEMRSLGFESYRKQLLGLLLWLTPPLMLSILTLLKISNLSFFILEFWYTPILPILSIKPYLLSNGRPLYYYVLLVLPFVMPILYISRFKNIKNNPLVTLKYRKSDQPTTIFRSKPADFCRKR